MECWTQNSWRTQKNHQDVKSNGYDKQTDDFLETFPNFMILTDEERHEFFQTLHTAKLKLENSGVTVKPFFGTVHDQSWNYLEALPINSKPSADNEAFTSRRVETDVSLLNKPAGSKSKLSVNRSSPAHSRNSVKLENSEKTLKESGIHPAFSQENLESVLGTNDSLESLGFEEKEVEVTSFNSSCKNNALKNSKKSIVSSLSYEILNKNDKSSLYQLETDDTLKITGTKLKVQVTLTSGDKDNMKVLRKPKKLEIDDVMPDYAERSGKSNCPKEGKKFDGTSIESINDSEIENLLNVEDDSSEELQEEKEKLEPEKTRKRSFDENKMKEKKAKLVNKNVSGKILRGKTEVSRHSLQHQISLKKEGRSINAVSENDKQRMFPRHSKTAVTIAKLKPKKEQNDNKTELSKCNSSVSKKEQKTNTKELNINKTESPNPDLNESKKISPEPKENPTATRQNILEVTTATKGAGPNTRLEKQGPEVSVKDKARLKLERQMRVEKLRKSLQKRESFYRRKLKKRNEKSASLTKKSTNEEVQTEENPNPTWTNPDIKEKKQTEIPCDSEKKRIAIPCTTEETKQAQINADTGKMADFVPTPVPGPAPVETSIKEQKKVVKGRQVLESKKGNLEEVKECIRPFKEGKVVFVDDNVIEKIKNVILDLEKKAKAEDCTENEYLVLVVDYVEYLSTVMATLFEDRVLNPAAGNPSVRFNDANLSEIQQCLRLSTPTTEDESEYNLHIRRTKKHKRNKPKKPSFIRRLKKFFNCGKNKKRRKAAGTSSDSSP